MPTGQRNDPYRSFRFRVEIDGLTVAGFREASGLDTTTDVIEYREGSEPATIRKLPGLTKFSNITLKRGVTDDDQLVKWRQQVVDGTIVRKSGSIVVMDQDGSEKLRWNFQEGWPTKWTGPSFNATGNEVAIETLEIAHEGLKKA
jgi:phage tail-like protein